MKIKPQITVYFFSFLALAGSLAALVIKDNRLATIASYPVLSTGYLSFANELRSSCFERVEEKPASFDFRYEISELNSTYWRHLQLEEGGYTKSTQLREFLDNHIEDFSKEGFESSSHYNMLVRVEVDSYYHTMIEEGSYLSDWALQLIDQKNYLEFYRNCGDSFVRSENNYSGYYALIQFKKGLGEEEEFAEEIEKGIFKFHYEKFKEEEFQHEVSRRGVKIYAHAVGLQPEKPIVLVPSSIDHLRETIQEVLISMQTSRSGLITLLEVVPYNNFPGFRERMNVSTGMKGLLTVESIQRAAFLDYKVRKMQERLVTGYDLAVKCHRDLHENYLSSPELQGKEFYFQSHFSNKKISARKFETFFKKHKPEYLLRELEDYNFNFGKGNGAIECLNQLELSIKSFKNPYNTKSCRISLLYRSAMLEFVSEYCMPRLAR